ncbi:DUF305 domain-containing protein [Paeniglutamicibacter sp. ABSL32-1]|uniref:DUF305 domain-containing protein n=1 Tax=Paeniglutamicibacter quisquiliarum TaxID=2849498 RepID=UPI001C2DE484|nr:DUF305 domain-containing protein [Paeniglutamicibacter quisquiliarum]MBV1778980.1 DUF305 domain-containing protein [Paeniglutamicibacter quisquiliarum]
MSEPKTSRALVIALVALMLAMATGGWILGSSNPRSNLPSEASPEAGFARDMQTHHHQAVQLSMIIREHSTNTAVRSMAYDMALTQQQQSGQMFAWLETWGLPQTGESMTWMNGLLSEEASHAGHGSVAPGEPHTMASMGMASEADIQRLTTARGETADRQFLTLMVAHHKGGVEMAEAYLQRGNNPMVAAFANKIVTTQQAEISALTQLLAQLS